MKRTLLLGSVAIVLVAAGAVNADLTTGTWTTGLALGTWTETYGINGQPGSLSSRLAAADGTQWNMINMVLVNPGPTPGVAPVDWVTPYAGGTIFLGDGPWGTGAPAPFGWLVTNLTATNYTTIDNVGYAGHLTWTMDITGKIGGYDFFARASGTESSKYADGSGHGGYMTLDRVSIVPVPGAALLIGLGLSLVGWLKRRIA